jgi:predicted ATPase/transcriptional regulator with XRE-family HTH domain
VSTIVYATHAEVQSFGEWLKQQRRRLDITQDQLASRCFCSVSTIRKIESDVLVPSHSLAEQLAVVLQIPVALQTEFQRFARNQTSQFLAQMASASQIVSAATLEATSPPLPTYHLPAPLNGLVGREREIQSGRVLLQRANVRLVTLLGPPGTGKTRLSLALAEALKDDFRDGACFVPLAPVSNPDLLLSAIAHALQVQESGGVALAQRLHDFLRPRQILLVLDNFEQIVEAAPVVSALLSAAPGIKVIVSSREPLKIYGEYEFPVPPLSVPDLVQIPSADLLEMYPAVELFVQRAQAVRADFVIDPQNGATIAQICAWLDGLPLAIEMAAAQIKWQTPTALLDQLRRQLMALTGSPRDLTPRQQTLRGAIDWSYNRLSAPESRLFRALAVVNGGCTGEIAAALADMEIEQCAILLRGLVEKSLLYIETDRAHTLRYAMLQVVREYAQDKLNVYGEANHLQARHAAIYRQLVDDSLPRLRTAEAEAILNRLESEHNNLRSALTWHLHADVAGGLALAILLSDSLWAVRGYYTEARSWLERLLAASPDLTQMAKAAHSEEIVHRAEGWLALARVATRQGDLAAAVRFIEISEPMANESQSDPLLRGVLRCRASICFQQSDYAQASRYFQEALALCHLDADQREAGMLLNRLGLIAKDQGDYVGAQIYHERSYTLFNAIGDVIGMAHSLTYASIATYWQGEFQRSIDFAEQCIALQSGIGDVMSSTYSREVQGSALVRLGKIDAGIELLQQCLSTFKQMDDRSGVAVTLVDLGVAAYLKQEMLASFRYHHQALEIAIVIGDRRRIAFSLEGIAMALAQLSTAQAETSSSALLERAVCAFGAAEALRQAIHAPLPETERAYYEACLLIATTVLPTDHFTRAWEEGRTAPLEQILQRMNNPL